MRLDELMRKFQAQGRTRPLPDEYWTSDASEKRRAENDRSKSQGRARKNAPRKEEIAGWFRIWLETPDVFFDWLDVRKQSPEFKTKFPSEDEEQETVN